MKLIKEVFIANGYLKKKVDEIMKKRPITRKKKTQRKMMYTITCSSLYKGPERKDLNIKTAFTAYPILRNLLVKVKGQSPSIPLSTAFHVVAVVCTLERQEDVRITEHRRAVYHLDKKNAMARLV